VNLKAVFGRRFTPMDADNERVTVFLEYPDKSEDQKPWNREDAKEGKKSSRT
jgi:hypothetical protein